jgi:hypothetical protein
MIDLLPMEVVISLMEDYNSDMETPAILAKREKSVKSE